MVLDITNKLEKRHGFAGDESKESELLLDRKKTKIKTFRNKLYLCFFMSKHRKIDLKSFRKAKLKQKETSANKMLVLQPGVNKVFPDED